MAEKKIVVTHINARQSISILILKLVTIDLIAATIIGLFYLSLLSGFLIDFRVGLTWANIILYAFFVIFEITLTIYVVLDWLSEYYEITPEHITHRYGILQPKEKKHKISLIDNLTLEQGFVGKFLKFGTISAYNYRHNRILTFYNIHNPHRYMAVLEKLTPEADTAKDLKEGKFIDLDKIDNTVKTSYSQNQL